MTMNETMLPVLFSGLGLAGITAIGTGIWWIVSRIMSYQGQFKNIEVQFKNVEVRFQSLEEKMDRGFKHLEEKIDSAIKHMDDKMGIILNTTNELLRSQNALLASQNDRMSRMERNYDHFIEKKIKE